MDSALLIVTGLSSIVLHEWAHAAVADLEGDPTPRRLGRLTLNPFAHLDPIGSVAVPAVLFLTLGAALGWCRPVPLTPARMRHGRRSLARVIAAGPAANLALAGLCALCGYGTGARVNLALAAFNLMPIGSLDGGRLLRLALRKGGE